MVCVRIWIFLIPNWTILKMTEKPLSDKINLHEDGFYYAEDKDVKEKIQNAQKRIEKELHKEMKSIKYMGCYIYVKDTIDRIFKEEFGEKLT